MAVLKIERGVGSGTTHYIDDESTLGRDALQASIHIADQKSSRIHARVFKENEKYYLEDLNSKNGTFLNGKPVDGSVELEPGDYIRIGFTWMSFGEELEIERIGKDLPAYEFLKEINEIGGTGLHFKVRQVGLDRMVTLNLLPPKIIKSNPQLKQRFREQAKSLAKLNHENIAIMLDFEAKEQVENSYLYCTTEYIEGESLVSLIKDKKQVPLITSLEIAIGVAKALMHAHEQNVVHQDINPSNIMICGDRVILGGFGVASVLSEVKETYSGLIGRTEYLSPEQILKQNITPSSDIYSLGIILYELLAGVPPFTGDNTDDVSNAIVNDTQTAITTYNPNVPAKVEHLIYQCLEKEIDQRPVNAEEVVNKLEDILVRQKVLELKQLPNIYTSGLLFFFVRLFSNSVFVCLFFPILSILILVILYSMIHK